MITPLFPTVSLPYPYPIPFDIAESHILKPPEDLKDDICEVNCYLDYLISEPVRREGCDWAFVLNDKVYVAKWRDRSPRPPWTRQVWDLYQIIPPCNGCPSLPKGLGWFWCWADLIKTIRFEVNRQWHETFSGPGGVVTAVGTNTLTTGSLLPQVGPVLWLDASDEDSITEAAGLISLWEDKSTFGNNAFQETIANQPSLVVAGQNGLSTIRFDPLTESFFNFKLKKQSDWSLLVVGKFNQNLTNPRGTFLAATGLEDPYSGIDGKIFQNATVQAEGLPFSFVSPNEVFGLNTISAGPFSILEWYQKVDTEGFVNIGTNAFKEQVFSGDTSQDFWDPIAQTFGQSIPILGAIGRSNQGINPGATFDYLDGEIGEILLYPEVLSEGKRIQILNVLRSKWNLGAPLAFPP